MASQCPPSSSTVRSQSILECRDKSARCVDKEGSEIEAAVKMLDSCISQIKWRLKHSSKRRLQTDVLALCTGMRPVVMVDYGGKMPELQERLCQLLQVLRKESGLFEQIEVMVIEDMIYLVHVRNFGDYIVWSLSSESEQCFVDLAQDPPKLIVEADKSSVAGELLSIQKWFSCVFTDNGLDIAVLHHQRQDSLANAESTVAEVANSYQSCPVIDLSNCMQDSQVTIPTLNGWLLGYPVVYLFGKDHISEAVYNLSTKYLHLFRVLACRNISNANSSLEEEIMSFTAPYDLSMDGGSEPWAEAFMSRIRAKLEGCKRCWRSLRMEVSECCPQAIVL